jgi:hypothetical protein
MTQPNVDPRQDLGSWSVAAGDPLEIDLQLNKPDGTGLDLTAFGSSWAGKLRQSSSSAVAQVFAIDATSAATGLLKLTLSPTQTSAMSLTGGDTSTWHFDLQITGGTMSPQTPFKGQVQVWRIYSHA